jgi:hypothetical protein
MVVKHRPNISLLFSKLPKQEELGQIAICHQQDRYWQPAIISKSTSSGDSSSLVPFQTPRGKYFEALPEALVARMKIQS